MSRVALLTRPSRRATLMRDGKFLVGGRASFVWADYIQARAAGIPGRYEIRSDTSTVWHQLDWTIEEAEQALRLWGMFGPKRLRQMRDLRGRREQRGLPVG